MSQAQQPEALRLADALAYCDSSVAAQAARELRTQHARIAELEQPQAALAAVPLPLLLRDIARELEITVPQACIALKPLGNYSTNSAVTPEMAQVLREHFPPSAHPKEGAPAPDVVVLVRELSEMLDRSANGLEAYRDTANWTDADEDHLRECRVLVARADEALAGTPAAGVPASATVRDEIQRLARFADCATRMNAPDMRNNMETLADELTKLMAATDAAGVPAAAPDALTEQDSICAWKVWWTHDKAKHTTTRQAALAAWNAAVAYAVSRSAQAARAPAAVSGAREAVLTALYAHKMAIHCDVDGDPAALIDFLSLDDVRPGVARDEVEAMATAIAGAIAAQAAQGGAA